MNSDTNDVLLISPEVREKIKTLVEEGKELKEGSVIRIFNVKISAEYDHPVTFHLRIFFFGLVLGDAEELIDLGNGIGMAIHKAAIKQLAKYVLQYQERVDGSGFVFWPTERYEAYRRILDRPGLPEDVLL